MLLLKDVNASVDLPRYVAEVLKPQVEYKFVKSPEYGWIAYDDDLTAVKVFSDFFQPEEFVERTRALCHEMENYTDGSILWTKDAPGELIQQLLDEAQMRLLVAKSIQSFGTHVYVRSPDQKTTLQRLVGDGYVGAASLGWGSLPNAEWQKTKYNTHRNFRMNGSVLLVPFWYAPGKLASVQSWNRALKRWDSPLYEYGDSGWSGNINGMIVEGAEQALLHGGLIWDSHLQFWLGIRPKISPDYSPKGLLQLWRQSRPMSFETDPLIELARKAENKEVFNSIIEDMTLSEVEQLTKSSRVDFTTEWLQSKCKLCRIGEQTYKIQNNRSFKKGKHNKFYELQDFHLRIKHLIVVERGRKPIGNFIGLGRRGRPLLGPEIYWIVELISWDGKKMVIQVPDAVLFNLREFIGMLTVDCIKQKWNREPQFHLGSDEWKELVAAFKAMSPQVKRSVTTQAGLKSHMLELLQSRDSEK